ncbi:MAG: hypothetical protein IJ383_04640 [Bacteroidales bacterium]|nr:hypothetical protein [Bacteroidales bacterium]
MRLLFLIISSLLFFACSGNKNVITTLNEVAFYIEEEPERALSQLREIKDNLGNSKEIRAKHALLHSMALDKNYIDLTNDSIIAPAVEYYSRKGSNNEKFLTYYYMGRIFQNANDLNNAAIEFSKAEDIIQYISDHKALGRLFMAFSDIYNSTRNSKKEIEYAQKGYEHYKLAKSQKDINLSLGTLAIAYSNRKEWELADSLYKEGLRYCKEDTIAMLLFLSNYARSKVLQPIKDPASAISLLKRKLYEYKEPLSIKDYGVYAYALSLQGRRDESDAIINSIKGKQTVELDFWLFLISYNNSKYKEAIDYLNNSYIQLDKEIESSLINTVDKSLKEFYKEQEYLSQIKSKTKIYALIILLFGLIAISSLIVLILVRHNNKQKKVVQRYLKYSEIASKQLDRYETELTSQDAKIENLQKLYAQTYKKQFKVIGELCLTYLTKINRKDIKDVIFRKVESMIDNLSIYDNLHSELEVQINKELNNIIKHLREDIPSLSQDDIRFICYCIIGFDAVLISTILNLSTSNVYTKKSRIRAKIVNLTSSHKDLYMRYI